MKAFVVKEFKKLKINSDQIGKGLKIDRNIHHKQ